MTSRAEQDGDTPTQRAQRRVREQFAGSGDAYVLSPGHARGEELPRLVGVARSRLGELAGLPALDVATGGGHTARTLAEAGMNVTASDLTPDMLAAAERYLEGLLPTAPIEFVAAAAESLPFADGAFALVTCRIAAHHFGDPRAFLAEARRVLAAGGVLVLIDNVAPEDAALAEAMNRVERLRDPSHVEAYPVSRWVAWAAEAGLEAFHLERFWRVKALETWLERARTGEAERAELRAFLVGAAPAVRAYLEVPGAAEASLRHEVMMLGASAGPT